MSEKCDWEGPHHCECHKEREAEVEGLKMLLAEAERVAANRLAYRQKAEAEYCVIAKDYDAEKAKVRKLEDLLHHARVRIRFMNGLVLSREQAIRSNAKLSGAAYIRALRAAPPTPRCDKRETGRFLRCDGFAGHPGAHHNKSAVWGDYPEGTNEQV